MGPFKVTFCVVLLFHKAFNRVLIAGQLSIDIYDDALSAVAMAATHKSPSFNASNGVFFFAAWDVGQFPYFCLSLLQSDGAIVCEFFEGGSQPSNCFVEEVDCLCG